MRSLLSILAMLCVCSTSYATNFSGGIYSNTTWTLANSPYIITGDVVVFDEYTLTIEPGVQVLVSGNYKIEVRGKLVCIGTESQNIEIKAETPTTNLNSWKGITFIGTTFAFTGQGKFEYTNISNAYVAINMDIAYHGPYTFKHCTFSYNRQVNDDGGLGGVLFSHCKVLNNMYGITHLQFGGRIDNCLFDGNEVGVEGSDSLTNCTFTNNTNVAAYPYGYTANCEFNNNNIAVVNPFNSVNNTFINNKIWGNNVGMEITSCFNDQLSTGNEICDNTQYNIVLKTTNNCNISNNCWCSTDATFIQSKILDGYTDITRGLITFAPFNETCDQAGLNPSQIEKPYIPVNNTEVYPNPAPAGFFRVRSTELVTAANTNLYDITGKKVNISIIPAGTNEYKINTLENGPGVYFLYIKKPMNKRLIQKIILE